MLRINSSLETEIIETTETKAGKNKKTVFAIIASVVVIALIFSSFGWVWFLSENPFAEIAFAAKRTFSKSAKSEVTSITEKQDKKSEEKTEIVFVNDKSGFSFSALSSNGKKFFANEDWIFSSETDGSVEISNREQDGDLLKVLELLKKGKIEEAAEFLNENVFEKELLNPENCSDWLFETYKNYCKKDYLEKHLGFSKKSEKGIKTFSFSFGVNEFFGVVCDVVLDSKNLFSDVETYESLLSLVKIASNIELNSEIELEIKIQNGRIIEIVFSSDTKTAEGDIKKSKTIIARFSDLGKADHDKNLISELEKYKNILGDNKRYKENSDGSYEYTDKNGKKNKFSEANAL